MNIQKFFKCFTLASTMVLFAGAAFGQQQWTGSSTLDGFLERNGNISVGKLYLGRYGGPYLGNTNPFSIYSDSYAGTQDLMLFGNNASTMNFRVTDGDFKVGLNTIPNAIIYNDGRAVFRSKLEVLQSSDTDWGLFVQNAGGLGKGIRIQAASTNNATPLLQVEDYAQNPYFVVNSSGGVGINTPNAKLDPDFKLSVNGKIRATEVKVYTGWADFVFAPGYRLRPLEEVAAHIQKHGRLPEVPSAQEVQAEGIGLGEANTLLLQKVEELTLYLIEQEKKTQALEERLAELEGGKKGRHK